MPERKPTIVTTSWDDGHPSDLRLAGLLSEHGIPGTFYICPRNRERAALTAEQTRRLAERFEIGAHSHSHDDLRRLSDDELERQLLLGRAELEARIGRPVNMFCYPYGRHNPRVRRAVIRTGFIGARTTRILGLDAPADPWEMPATIAARDLHWSLWFAVCLRRRNWTGLRELATVGVGKSWVELACALFERARLRGGVWHLRGHSWEVEEGGLWSGLREILRFVSGRDDVLYMTNGDLVRRVSARDG